MTPSAILGSEEQMLRHLCVMQEVNAETGFDFSFCITQTKPVWYALLSHSSALDVGSGMLYFSEKRKKRRYD
jgi:hypothetical protein